MRNPVFVILALVGSLFGCGEDGFPKYVHLDRLRVLALAIDDGSGNSEVSPGATVTITPYISDTQGGTRELTYSAEACVDPGIAYGADPTCSGQATLVVLATNAPLTEPAAPHRTGALPETLSVTVPTAGVIFAGRTPSEQFNGVPYLVTYTIQAPDGETVRSFARVIVSDATKTAKNMNPVFSDILANGTSLTALPAGPVNLTALYSAASIESYSAMKSDGSTETRTESLVTTWFLSAGDVKYYRTQNSEATTFTPPVVGTAMMMIAVQRDGRGGVAVVMKSL